MPLHLLVTEKPPVRATNAYDPRLYREAAWLFKRHAISVLPSVASLKALRDAKKSTAPNEYVAFGDPLLLGSDGTDTSALDRQQCPKDVLRLAANKPRGATQLRGISAYFRGNLADVAEVQKLPALPETTDEVCGVARRLGVPDSEIWLGKKPPKATSSS